MRRLGAMALWIAGFVERPAATGASSVDDVRGAMANRMAPPGGIPLELGQLLAPYEHYRHLSLRVERLPVGARLSSGRNNGDRTWSLAVDELDGLTYIAAPGDRDAQTLAIRIFNLDGDYAQTIGIVEVTVAPGGAAAVVPASAAAPPSAAPAAVPAPAAADAELSRLREELTAAQAALATREKELADARSGVEEARKGATAEAQAALRKAEESWKASEAARLGAAEAKWRD